MRELDELAEVLKLIKPFGYSRELATVAVSGENFPIFGLVIGSQNLNAPTLGLFGGVHGLERVGSQVVINYLKSLLNQLRWDNSLQNFFKDFRIVSIPIVNPGGMHLNTRSNPNGVDIMRNAPIDATGDLKWLVSGHRLSSRLPWYRGRESSKMELETTTLIEFVRQEMLGSQFSMAVDVHSGFGLQDRFWHPYSSSSADFPYLSYVKKLKNILNDVLPFHVYRVQPQAESYLLHGDPWDLIFNEHHSDAANSGKIFIPWCLEMGSWTWLRKNPSQIFYKQGIFNPILPHRYNRIMRRHKPLFDFLRSAISNHPNWSR